MRVGLGAVLLGLCGLYAAGLLPPALTRAPVRYVIIVDGGEPQTLKP